MDGQQGGSTPPQYSPDGRWWWDGQQWVAAPHARAVVPAAPPKARMPHQRRSFWIGLGVVTLLLVGTGVCVSALASSPRTQPGARAASVTSTDAATPTATATPTRTPTAAPTAIPTAPPAPTATPPVAAAPPATAPPAPPPATPAGCYPLTNSGTCYEPGEFCRTTDHGRTGRAGNGEAIVCEYNNGWRWEPV